VLRMRQTSLLAALLVLATSVLAPSAVAKKRVDPVRQAVKRASVAGEIDAATADRYLEIYKSAVRLRPRLPFVRERELSYVIDVLRRLGHGGRLNASRMPALFLILDRNRQWWATKGPPATNARVRFAPSEVLFEYYPGRGLQLQPLANFGLANGFWQSHQDERLRTLVDELVAVRTTRVGFATWEYDFDFGGGSPPWISGMAQATAMQALARAGTRLSDPALLDVARSAAGAFKQKAPLGVLVPRDGGSWYPLYSFAPRLYVLNGMLQTLIGLDTYRTLTGDPLGSALFDAGDRVARAHIAEYDTGAWSLYSRSPTGPGAEANLNYHTLNRDFARKLCRITTAPEYCTSADNFASYLRAAPTLQPFAAAPAPATGGRGVRFHFTLSKVGRVGITVKESESGRVYLSTSAPFSHGVHFFRWVPPRMKREHTYDYTLLATDLAGNKASEQGTIRVKPR
jgi:hypothetical protein